MPTTEHQVQQAQENGKARYILITQCLQNDFFLNRECKLRLPDYEVKKMLMGGKSSPDLEGKPGGSRVQLGSGYPAKGPLGLFLEAVIGRRRRGKDGRGTLHVINIRDWHEPGASYDQERCRYGSHCEARTWGADYIEGLGKYLDPAGKKKSTPSSAEGQFFEEGSVRIYHVHSDSVFDFKPRSKGDGSRPGKGKFLASELENILDVIVLGSPKQVTELTRILRPAASPDGPGKTLDELAEEVNATPQSPARVYLAVIGVYTDIKVKTLLMGLRSRYDIPSLSVSDTLTASPSLERHLGALDFAQKVLIVEVIHGLNNLIRFLGGTPSINNELEIVAADRFSDYVSYFQDKQNVLVYQAAKLQEYVHLTQRRAEDVYRTVKRANQFLIWWGSGFLLLTAVGAILSAVWPDRFDWKLPLVTGGLSLLQLVSAFFWRPMADLQKNLTNLATFRMILESHSLKTALARFHLTTPQTLRDDIDSEAATKQVQALEAQIEAIKKIEECDYQALKGLGFGAGETARKVLEVTPEE